MGACWFHGQGWCWGHTGSSAVGRVGAAPRLCVGVSFWRLPGAVQAAWSEAGAPAPCLPARARSAAAERGRAGRAGAVAFLNWVVCARGFSEADSRLS